jgi:hypothetical protein
VSISIRDVSSVGTEVSDAKTFVQMNRPMRRIVIASVRDGHVTTIDVSMSAPAGNIASNTSSVAAKMLWVELSAPFMTWIFVNHVIFSSARSYSRQIATTPRLA